MIAGYYTTQRPSKNCRFFLIIQLIKPTYSFDADKSSSSNFYYIFIFFFFWRRWGGVFGLPFENQKSIVYVVNWIFSRHFVRYQKYCHNLSLLASIYQIRELFDEVWNYPLPKRVSKIQQVKFETSEFT